MSQDSNLIMPTAESIDIGDLVVFSKELNYRCSILENQVTENNETIAKLQESLAERLEPSDIQTSLYAISQNTGPKRWISKIMEFAVQSIVGKLCSNFIDARLPSKHS